MGEEKLQKNILIEENSEIEDSIFKKHGKILADYIKIYEKIV